MNQQKLDIAYFVAFSIEQYKHAHNIGGHEAMRILNSFGVLDYLAEHYEILKTIYNSDTYQRLEIEDTKLWHLGPVALYEVLA